jgi:acyl-CoA thioester hydrolase
LIPPYEAKVGPDWIDYNGHMRDASYGMAFSLAIDAFQEAIGFDRAYRDATDCTVYLLEDHKRYIREVFLGAQLRVTTDVLDFDAKRFLLRLDMFSGGMLVCSGEFLEMHVNKLPTPHAAPMPESLRFKLAALKGTRSNATEKTRVSKQLSLMP